MLSDFYGNQTGFYAVYFVIQKIYTALNILISQKSSQISVELKLVYSFQAVQQCLRGTVCAGPVTKSSKARELFSYCAVTWVVLLRCPRRVPPVVLRDPLEALPHVFSHHHLAHH